MSLPSPVLAPVIATVRAGPASVPVIVRPDSSLSCLSCAGGSVGVLPKPADVVLQRLLERVGGRPPGVFCQSLRAEPVCRIWLFAKGVRIDLQERHRVGA